MWTVKNDLIRMITWVCIFVAAMTAIMLIALGGDLIRTR